MEPSIDIQDPEIRAWFGSSCVVDGHGAPLLVFRGEHGQRDASIFQCRLGAITFADVDSAADYAKRPNDCTETANDPRVMPAYLRIERPFIFEPDDPYLELSAITEALGEPEARRIALKFASWIQRTDNWHRIEDEIGRKTSIETFLDRFPQRLSDLYFMAYPFLDDPEETARLRAAGFDGAVHAGSAVTAGKPEYKAFDPGSILPATSRWLTPDEAQQFDAGHALALAP